RARFEESRRIILEAWKGEPFSYDGNFYRIKNATVGPRPYQRPHPPLRMAANSRETFPIVGRLGLPLFVGLRDLSIPELHTHLAAYRSAWREAGHPGRGDGCLRIPLYVGATQEDAVQGPRAKPLYFFRPHARPTRAGLRRGD